MFKLNGNTLPLDTAFTVGAGDDAIQYPANWLRLSTPEDRTALGIVEIVAQPRPDDKFYFVQDNGDGTFTSTPKDLDAMKTVRVAELKSNGFATLSKTEWYISRASDPTSGKPIPDIILTERTSARSQMDSKEAAINACQSIPDLMGIAVTINSEPAIEVVKPT